MRYENGPSLPLDW